MYHIFEQKEDDGKVEQVCDTHSSDYAYDIVRALQHLFANPTKAGLLIESRGDDEDHPDYIGASATDTNHRFFAEKRP